jgi:hypothetical protein
VPSRRLSRVDVAHPPHLALHDAVLHDNGRGAHYPAPAKLAARVRLLSTGHGLKSNEADAVSVGVAALNFAGFLSVEVDEAISALRAVVAHRDDLVRHLHPDR